MRLIFSLQVLQKMYIKLIKGYEHFTNHGKLTIFSVVFPSSEYIDVNACF